MHAYVDIFREMLYKFREKSASSITKIDLQTIFSDDQIYTDYTNMLRKKYIFLRSYNALQENEALFLIS
jgi:hypothetical protein